MSPTTPRITREAYDLLPGVNWSSLKHMGKSPAHYLHAIQNKSTDDTDARQRGRVVHMAVFEPERFAADVVVWPEKRVGKAYEAFLERHEGREVVTPRMMEAAETIATAARSNPMAAKYLAGGMAEHTIRWTYRAPEFPHLPAWAIDCKGRLDFVSEQGAIVDLKSTRDASPLGFGREVMRYEAHAQAAFYVDGYEAMTGVRLPFLFVAVEAAAPQVVQVYRVTDEQLALGRERYEALLAHLQVCRSESRWPGYAEAEMELSLPHWATHDDDEGVDPELVFAD